MSNRISHRRRQRRQEQLESPLFEDWALAENEDYEDDDWNDEDDDENDDLDGETAPLVRRRFE